MCLCKKCKCESLSFASMHCMFSDYHNLDIRMNANMYENVEVVCFERGFSHMAFGGKAAGPNVMYVVSALSFCPMYDFVSLFVYNMCYVMMNSARFAWKWFQDFLVSGGLIYFLHIFLSTC